MSRYASNTDVPSDRSRAEIERTLARYGADEFMYGTQKTQAAIGFKANGKNVRFILPLPDRNNREFTHTPERGTRRAENAIETSYEQAIKQRWRALALVIKAKLEAVEAGIVTFEDEFAMHMLLPDGSTVREHATKFIEDSYAGKSTSLLAIEGGN